MINKNGRLFSAGTNYVHQKGLPASDANTNQSREHSGKNQKLEQISSLEHRPITAKNQNAIRGSFKFTQYNNFYSKPSMQGVNLLNSANSSNGFMLRKYQPHNYYEGSKESLLTHPKDKENSNLHEINRYRIKSSHGSRFSNNNRKQIRHIIRDQSSKSTNLKPKMSGFDLINNKSDQKQPRPNSKIATQHSKSPLRECLS